MIYRHRSPSPKVISGGGGYSFSFFQPHSNHTYVSRPPLRCSHRRFSVMTFQLLSHSADLIFSFDVFLNHHRNHLGRIHFSNHDGSTTILHLWFMYWPPTRCLHVLNARWLQGRCKKWRKWRWLSREVSSEEVVVGLVADIYERKREREREDESQKRRRSWCPCRRKPRRCSRVGTQYEGRRGGMNSNAIIRRTWRQSEGERSKNHHIITFCKS